MPEYLQLDMLPEYCFSFFATPQQDMPLYVKSMDYDVLCLALGGTLSLQTASAGGTLHGGEWYIHKAATPPPVIAQNEAAKIYVLFFRGHFGRSAANALPMTGHFPLHSVSPLAERLDTLAKDPTSPRFLLVTHFYLLCAQLLSAAALPRRRSAMNDIQAYLRVCFSEKIDMAQLARQYGYSPDHMTRKFRQAFGVTPAVYLRSVRIQQALRLLTHPDASLQSVSEACGYSDYSTFYRAFVAQTGVSPNQWMEQIQK